MDVTRRGFLSPVLGAAFWIFLLLAVVSLLRGPTPGARLQERLRSGVALMEGGKPGEAREIFMQIAGEGDSLLAGTAYHNLALLSLHASLAGVGREAAREAREAVELGEISLRLRPGSEASAWNLELALRRLAELEGPSAAPPPSAPEPDSESGQQRQGSPADTEGEGESPEEGNARTGTDAAPRLSEVEARRILASFRLLEAKGALEAIRSQMREASRSTPHGRRGPPW